MSAEETPQKSSLVRKLAEVMAVCHRIPKNGENKFAGYKYVMAADVLDLVRAELAARSIIVWPRITDVQESVTEGKNAKGDAKLTRAVLVKMAYSFEDGDTGEVREVPWAGIASDTSDKAIWKCLTGCQKYLMLQVFLLSQGDDPENDGGRKPETPTKRGKSQPPQVPMAEAPQGDYARITSEQWKALWDTAKYYWGIAPEAAKKRMGGIVRSIAGVAGTKEIPADKYDAVMAAVKAVAGAVESSEEREAGSEG